MSAMRTTVAESAGLLCQVLGAPRYATFVVFCSPVLIPSCLNQNLKINQPRISQKGVTLTIWQHQLRPRTNHAPASFFATKSFFCPHCHSPDYYPFFIRAVSQQNASLVELQPVG